MMMYKQANNKGSALLSALFIMTLVAIAATAMTTRLQLDIYRSRLLINSDKRYLASQAVSFWTIEQLKNQKINFKKADKAGVVAIFPKALENIYPDFPIQGKLIDLQSKFNINTINNKPSQAMFNTLLQHLLPNKSALERRALLEAVKNWISPYKPENGSDPYRDIYLKKSPAYQSGHQAMKSITELRLVEGINQSIYQKLVPYLSALPDDKTLININTAPLPLIMSLGNGLKKEQALELIQARGKTGFKDLKKIEELLKKLGINNKQITIESDYYLSVATVNYDHLNLNNYSVFKREKGEKGHSDRIKVKLVIETINSL